MATFLQRQWRRNKGRAKRAASKAVDAAVDIGLPAAGAYIGGALGTLCGPAAPVCVPAGYALGAYAGTKAAPKAKRTVKRTGTKAREWLEWEEADGPPPPRPEELPTDVVGSWGPSTVGGEYETEEPVNWAALTLVMAAIGAATYASWSMYQRRD